jgi:hypothetical protein
MSFRPRLKRHATFLVNGRQTDEGAQIETKSSILHVAVVTRQDAAAFVLEVLVLPIFDNSLPLAQIELEPGCKIRDLP